MKLDLANDRKKAIRLAATLLLLTSCATFNACDSAPNKTAQGAAVQPASAKQTDGQQEDATKWDQYVTLPKIFPFDLKSAQKELEGKTVWVRAGNSLPYYVYNPGSATADLKRKAGTLPPLEKLVVKRVFLQKAPVTIEPARITVLEGVVFAAVERSSSAGMAAIQVGTNSGQDYKFTANDLLYFADPHVLYKHWPAAMWAAVDSHQAKVGMNELQAEMALGTNAKYTSGNYGDRTIEYATSAGAVKITFQKNKAVKIASVHGTEANGGS